jgi:2-phosphosulfolactate phosphatase
MAGKTVVVGDILRATTTMMAALLSGAEKIIPVESKEKAFEIKNESPEVLLCGEENSMKIEGFDLGNSPQQYTTSKVKDKTLVFKSTNGSGAILAAGEYAERVVVGSFANLSAVARSLIGTNEIVVLCAGSDGAYSHEDTYYAGRLISKLLWMINPKINTRLDARLYAKIIYEFGNVLIDDASMAALLLGHSTKHIEDILTESKHGNYLMEKGFGSDFKFASAVDVSDTVPEFIDGAIMCPDEDDSAIG